MNVRTDGVTLQADGAYLHFNTLAFKRKLIKKKKKKISHSHFISFDGEDSLTDASIKLGKYFTTTFGAIRP